MAELDQIRGRAELVSNRCSSNANSVGVKLPPVETAVRHAVRERFHKPPDKPFRGTTAALRECLRKMVSHMR